MPDVVVDHAYLDRTAAGLEQLSLRLAGLAGDLRGVPSLAVGAAALFDELVELAAAWATVLDTVHREAQHAARFVAHVRSTFEAADLATAQAAVRAHRERSDG